MTAIDMRGRRYGRLTVLSRNGSLYNGEAAWLCACSCGNTTTITGTSLRKGVSTSCGCFGKEQAISALTTHGKRHTRAYAAWTNMKTRCYNPKSSDYKDYGARGITVCTRWHKFENFYKDMGDPPDGRSLDRRNNSKGYSPDNCRWATPDQQANNTRKVAPMRIRRNRP